MIKPLMFMLIATGILGLPAAMAQPEQKVIPSPTAKVVIEGFQFKPDTIVIKKGSTVTFTNQDTTPHTVTPEEKTAFLSTGRLSKDSSKTVTFEKVGIYPYFCEIHPSMQGKVQVVE